jgi:hypothetical protein
MFRPSAAVWHATGNAMPSSRPIGFPLGALLARSGDAALIRHEKEQNLTPPSFSRNDSPAVFVSATPNLLEVSR